MSLTVEESSSVPPEETGKTEENVPPMERAPPKEKAPPKEIKAFVCELCNVTTTSETNLQDHLQGARHMKKVINSGQPALPGLKMPVVSVQNPKGVQSAVSTATQKGTLDLKSTKEALVGLEYIAEQESSAEPGMKVFKCELCGIVANIGSVMSHIVGYKHKMAYLEKHSPDEHKLLSGLPKSEQTVALQRMVHEAEKKNGRGKIKYLPQQAQKRALPQNDAGPGKRIRKDSDYGGNYAGPRPDGNFARNRGPPFEKNMRYQRNNFDRPNYNERRYSDGYGGESGRRMMDEFRDGPNEDFHMYEMANDGYSQNYPGSRDFDGYQRQGPNPPRRQPGGFSPIPPDYPIEMLLAAVEKKFRLPGGSLGTLLPVMNSGVVVNDAQAKMALNVSNGLTQALLKFRKQSTMKEQILPGGEHFREEPNSLPPARSEYRRATANNVPTALSQSAYNMHAGYSTKNVFQRRQQTETGENYQTPQHRENEYHQQEKQMGQAYEYKGEEFQHEQDYSGYNMQQGQDGYQLPQKQHQYQRQQTSDTQPQYQYQQVPEPEHSSFTSRPAHTYSRF